MTTDAELAEKLYRMNTEDWTVYREQIIAALRRGVGIHIGPGVEDAHISGARIEGNVIHHSGHGIKVEATESERQSGDYVMVPREPTEAQRHLAMMNDSPSYRTSSLVFYRAMLTAVEASKGVK